MYYNAKCLKTEDRKAALDAFEEVLKAPQTEENIEWIFKAYKQMIKVSIVDHQYDRAIFWLTQLVEIIPQVNQNYVEESISRMLNNYSNSEPKFVERMYEIILEYLNRKSDRDGGPAGNNRRLWLKMNIHILNIQLEEKNWLRCSELIDLIKANLETASESTRNTYSLELIAAEIQVLSRKSGKLQRSSQNLSGLNALYKRAMKITTAVTHPKIMGIIRECGGKVQFYRGDYESARLELYESFKNFDEAGSSHKKKILKYLALCSLLTENQFNPFESQETQTYAQLPEYAALIQLITYYDELNLPGFKRILKQMNEGESDHGEVDDLADDDIFKHSSTKILHHLRSSILTNILKSYSKIKLSYLSEKLEISKVEVEKLILQCINLGKFFNFKIDFVDDFVERAENQAGGIIPITLGGSEILDNVHCLHAIDYFGQKKTVEGFVEGDVDEVEKGAWDAEVRNEVEQVESGVKKEEQKTPTLDIYLFQWQRVTTDRERAILLDGLLESITSGIPKEVKDKLTQKEQVIQEQRITGKGGISAVNNGSGTDSNPGLLASASMHPAHLDDEDDGDEDSNLDKIDMLRIWWKEIQKFQQGNRF